PGRRCRARSGSGWRPAMSLRASWAANAAFAARPTACGCGRTMSAASSSINCSRGRLMRRSWAGRGPRASHN
ncbi:hypothetical protein LTR94_036235, partial [Friedmanniomyces endolithicus]